MIIIIKGNQYENPRVEFEKGVLEIRLFHEGTFADIVEAFNLEAGDEITQLNDNEETIGLWNVNSMNCIRMPEEGGDGTVTIRYNVSQLGIEAQEVISADVDDATNAVLELCELTAIMQEQLDTDISRVENSISDTDSRLTQTRQTVNQINESVSNWESMYNTLADRVARLENKEGE